MKFNREKFKELILYICEKSKDDIHFDMKKLGVILWKCDFKAYAELGESLTGATYIKDPDDPIS